MNVRLKTLLAGLLLTCSQAHAGVLYSWQYAPGSANALPQDITLQIEFSDAAVAAGSVHYVVDNCGMPEFCGPDPDAPVTRFLFDGVTWPISYAPTAEAFNPFAMLTVSVRFEAGGYLSGFIAANDTASQLFASSAGTLFTIDDVRSDRHDGGGCDLWSDECHGATGYLRAQQVALTAAPAASLVPEPSALALLGAGLAGLFGARRLSGRSERTTRRT